ncbi:hypothetical protein [Actinomyces urogenitalis]|uniref:hypothetical protein n=1 Tax=Actinomyces urogenitalis TaxID=103621 RepID=UPI001899778F|nr:hypothetical protein [Actinomyces urogenitalis]
MPALPADEPSELEELLAMKHRLKAALYDDGTPARDLAALSRRQIEVMDRIKEIRAAEQEKDDDGGDQKADEEWTGV